jgi:hypothetical protein
MDGFVFRFAACQFGQKTAGSPLAGARLPCSRHGSLFRSADGPGEEREARILVITFDAILHIWAVLRTSPGEPGIEVVE